MKNKNRIPKSFTLGGLKFKVETKEKVKPAGGSSDPFECIIQISKTVKNSKCSEDYQRQTFYHELVHQIFIALGELKLSDKEKLIQRFSLLLDQFEQTKEF
jgi:hypothetical protein